jgi:hypothetical protein
MQTTNDHHSAIVRAAQALLQAHQLAAALAENLLQALDADSLLTDNAAEYERRGYDRLYMAALNDEDSATMQEHLQAALQANR